MWRDEERHDPPHDETHRRGDGEPDGEDLGEAVLAAELGITRDRDGICRFEPVSDGRVPGSCVDFGFSWRGRAKNAAAPASAATRPHQVGEPQHPRDRISDSDIGEEGAGECVLQDV
jgi:hypothetical protein